MTRRVTFAYFATLIAFLALDAVWLSTMVERLYKPAIGHLMRDGFALPPAIAFYVLYILGLVVFAVTAGLDTGRATTAAWRGALFGLVAYATYDLTNQATMRDWPWAVTLADLAWGTFASALACAAGCRAAMALARKDRR
jgi:uncharacterized membrane protein